MNRTTARITGTLLASLVLLALCAGLASAREVQLAGLRLGQHAINLLDVYGQPDGIVVGEGPAAEPSAAQMGMMAGMPPMVGGPALMAPPMAMAGGPPMPPGLMAPGMPGMAGPMGGLPTGAGAFPGMPGMPGAAAAGGGGGGFPTWALAVYVDVGPFEVEWIYNKGPVVMGFVLDRDGYINTIAVCGEDCGYARTALWRPHQYVQLGDDFKRVLYRYGYPSTWLTFSSDGPGEASPGTGSVTVSFSGTSRVFSRDVILQYEEENNIAFTLHNMKVTRIHIWR